MMNLQNIDMSFSVVYVTLISQILMISIFLATKWRNNRNHLLTTYPPSDYPNLYVNSEKVERSRLKIRLLLDRCIAIAGLMLVCAYYFTNTSITLVASTIKFVAAVQLLPWFLSAYWCKENNKLMAENFPSTTRKSSFQSRNLADFVTPLKLSLAVCCYLMSAIFAIYIYKKQLWSAQSTDSLLLMVLSTAIVFYLGWTLFNSLYGKKKDHFISSEDRLKIIATKCNKATLFIIMYSVFIFGVCLIKTFSISHDYVDVMTSIFIQLLLLLSVEDITNKNYEVYK